jgi:hypothetical protein
MVTHARPYKCTIKGCEKRQGFTKNGGLLRHEREVHKLHGGSKRSCFCPFKNCERSSGVSFTRKENLAEHIRRVHRKARKRNLPDFDNEEMWKEITRLRQENDKIDSRFKELEQAVRELQ